MKKATVRIVQRKRLADKASGVADSIYQQRIKLLPVFVMVASLAALIYLRVRPESSKQVSRLIESSFGQISRLSFLWSPAALLTLLSGAALLYMWMDYRHHKKPLIRIAPKTKYGMLHHIRVVMLPRFHYRWRPAFYWLAVAEVCAAAFIATVALVGVPAASAFSGNGLGTEVSPYIITSCEQLQEMRDDLDGHYELGGPIDCSDTVNWNAGRGFIAAADGSGADFTGTLDGQGYAIDGLYQREADNNNPEYVGLVGTIYGATIRNLRLTNVDIATLDPDSRAGSLASFADSATVSDVAVDGTLAGLADGNSYVAGLIGYAENSTILRVSATIELTIHSSRDEGFSSTAGLVALADTTTMQDVYSSGTLSMQDNVLSTLAGGLVGYQTGGSINRGYSNMSITVNHLSQPQGKVGIEGGLVGLTMGGSTLQDVAARGAINTNINNVPIESSGSLVGAVILANPPNDINIAGSQNYVDANIFGGMGCIGSYVDGNSGSQIPDQTPANFCTGVNQGNSQPNYFINNSTNPPFNNWDFVNVWKTQNNGMPIFTWQEVQAPTLPGQVRSLTTTSSNTTSLTAQWLAPLSDGNSAITNYAVQYKLHSAGTWTTVTRAPSTTTSQLISGLAAGQLYDIRVAAINDIGQGDWRVTENVTTNQLPTVPQNFVISGVQGTTEFGDLTDFYFPKLDWQVPTTGAPITDYVIQYKVNPGPDWDAMEEDLESEGVPWVTQDWVTVADGTNTNLDFYGMDNVDPYLTQALILNAPLEANAVGSIDFRVAAVNTHGQGPWTSDQNFQVFVGLTECQQMHDKLDQYPMTLFHLMNDIDCSDTINWNSGAGWEPLQTRNSPFTGALNGQGYTISSLYINMSDNGDNHGAGMFAATRAASIRNLTMADVSVTGAGNDMATGALIAFSAPDTVLSDIDIQGSVAGEDFTGGIVGVVSDFANTNSTGSVIWTDIVFSGSVDSPMNTGGVLGAVYVNVESGLTLSNVQSHGSLYSDSSAGGIVGGYIAQASLTLQNASSDSTISGYCTDGTGGLIGIAAMGALSIVSSSYDGSLSCQSVVVEDLAFVGGLVGAVQDSGIHISNSTTAGQITYGSGSAGGLVGFGAHSVTIDPEDPEAAVDQGIVISGSSSSMDIDSPEGAIRLVGGLVGAATLLDINNSHATGSITVGDGDQAAYGVSGSAGGLVGQLSGGLNLVSALRINNSHATGAISFEAVSPVDDSMGGPAVGGAVGMVVGWSKLENVYATGNVSMTLNAACQVDECDWMQARAGGVAGYVSAPEALEVPVAINEVHATGEVSSDNHYASAMIGGAFGDISVPVLQLQDTYATGRVITYQDDSAYSGSVAGGLAGSVAVLSASTLQSLYATGNVSGSANYRIVGIRDFFWPESSGGLIGALQGPVSLQKSYATGNVEGGGAVGGLIGSAARLMYGEIEDDARSIQNTYATGNVTGFKDRSYFSEDSEFYEGYLEFGTRAGGLIGYAANTSVAKSYASGVLTNQQPEFAGESEAYWNYLYGASSGGLIGQVGFGLPNIPPDGQVVLSDSFSAVTMQDTADNTKGVLIGDFWWMREPGDGQSEVELNTLIENTYYDIYRSGALSCSNEIAPVEGAQPEDITITTITLNDQTVCKPVNSGNQTPDYFKNNTTNPPLNTWDFSAPIWYSHVTIYPTFQPGEGVPGPPRDLGGVPTTSSMALSWNPPLSDGGSPIINYRLQYRRNGTTDWTEYSHPVSTATSYTITGLTSGARYDFQVSAINAVGQSTWTLGIYDVLVPGEPPIDPPDPQDPNPPNPPQPPRPTRPTGSSTPVASGGGEPVVEEEILDIAKLPDNVLPGLLTTPERTTKVSPVPYFFISWLILLAMYYAYRAWQEHRYQQAMAALLTRTKNTEKGVSDFLAITTHYLGTPLSILKGAIELIASKHALQPEFVKQFQAKLEALQTTTTSLTTQNEQAMQAAPAVVSAELDQSEPRKQLWIPLAAIALIIVVTDVALMLSKSYNQTWGRSLNHLIWAVGGTIVVGVSYLAWTKQKKLKAQYRQELERERALLAQKSAFVGEASQTLVNHATQLRAGTAGLEQFPDTKLLMNGLTMLDKIAGALAKVQRFSVMHDSLPSITVSEVYTRDIAPQLASEATNASVTVQASLPQNVLVQMQPEEFTHIMDTTVRNAIQFSEANSTVRVGGQDGSKAVVTVNDNGSGIDPEALAHIFEPVTRGTDTTTFDHEGLGLNLFITKLVLQKYGGDITIKSKPGSGTTVGMTIPKGHADPTGAAPQVIVPQGY